MKRKNLNVLGGVTGLAGAATLIYAMTGGVIQATPPASIPQSNDSVQTTLVENSQPTQSFFHHTTKEVTFTPPDFTITGGEDIIPVGEEVAVNVKLNGQIPDHLKSVKYDWHIFLLDNNGKFKSKKNFHIDEQKGNAIWFAAGIEPKVYHIFVSTSSLYQNGNQVGHFAGSLETDVVVGGVPPNPNPTPPGPNPPPGPGPTPPPGPSPVFPDAKYKLSSFVYDNVNKLVPSEARVKGAAALANSFTGVKSAIAAGTVHSLTEGLKKTQQADTDAISAAGLAADSWTPFLKALTAKVYDLYKAKTLNNQNDLADAWGEVSIGLNAIK